jgi:hypothetical protein
LDFSDDGDQGVSEWADISPSTSDKHQDYVFFLHVILAIIISFLSFTDGWGAWAAGTGLLTPILLVITGVGYGITIGINWYRDEFIPYISKGRMIPEFESDRFLQYKRMWRRFIPLSGYISTAITQYVWSFIAFLTLSIDPSLGSVTVLLFLIFSLMLVLYFVLLLVWLTIFDRILETEYSDTAPIRELEDEMREYRQRQKELEQESETN